jgi:prepilin-type N-terminal cleavage/methylation domain-containing protein
MTHRQRRRGRSAFTLVELMVVITIIAILVALLTTAVMNALNKGPELVTSSEIGELQAKLTNVIKNPANPLVFVPSRLHLNKKNNYGATQLDIDSKAYLQARFGKHTCFDFQNPPPGGQFIDWNGDNNPNEDLFLEGQQCLVFHLGGLPVYSPANTVPAANVTGAITMVGFSNNPQNPAAAPTSGAERRQGPYFEFQGSRLVSFTSAGSTGSYPIYWDPWTHTGGNALRKPYAFFASYNTEGGGLYNKYGGSDCSSLGALMPYQASAATATAPAVFLNPNSFQIISAGKNGLFGAGGTNWSRSGTTDPNGKDDQSNFSAHLLGMAP